MNAEIKKLFVAVTIACLGTIFVSISAHAGRNLAFDDKGNLFVVDRNSESIFKFTPDGTKSTFASGDSADDVAFDSLGNLFVWDGNTIFKFTPDGKRSTFASGLAPEAWDLAFDRSGNLFVTDHASGSILKFTPEGKKSTFASGLASEDLAFDRSGNLFVTDKGSDSILKFTSDGKRSTFASGLGHPVGLTFDDKGNLLVSVFVKEYSSHSILKFTPEGVKSTFATGLKAAGDLAFDRSGNLFVADMESDSILKFTPDGKKSTFATGISYPGDLVFDRAGNLFVSGSGLIFKFTPDGTRSTLVSDRVSPDKQWEYHSAERERIVKAGTSQTVLDLSEELPDLENAKIVWAPDSKRVAFNYSQPCKHCTYDTIAFYQLRDDKWVRLRSPVDQASESTQLAQLAEKYLPKNSYRRRFLDSSPEDDTLKVRKWADANTAILYAYSQTDKGQGAVLFTMKFDAEGNWKIVKTHRLSKKELEKELQEEL